MALDQRKYEHKHTLLLRDIRPLGTRIADALRKRNLSTALFIATAFVVFFPGMFNNWPITLLDVIFISGLLYFWWLTAQDRSLAFKLPMGAKFKDKNNEGPGRDGSAEGILYLGNVDDTDEEVWFSNSDARTHVLFLGTTGSGKTVGLTSMVTNALTWGSGFVYVDGKADTDLWSKLSSLCRRFGRDDDLLVLNYMTGNSDVKAPSNTMNPFSSGSASYLVNMLVELMPDSEGDNAMWKERAVSLIGAMMPVLTWKRDNQDIPMSVRTIRDNLSLNNVVKLARDSAVPADMRNGITGYLDTLPGFVHEAYDDNGAVKAPEGGGPPPDTTTASQQHGYLAMQFTRSLQSLGDDYGYIFDTQAADVDMVDVVLNRRVLIVLIPALEKSGDEIANLGKIVASTMKGMMGSALGSTVEGESSTVIENKPTNSATPFMTVFDEVGYYTAAGMAVMAAQARSLGFCLIFSGQDLPAMKKRVREEANSITANCNIKLFGKLEDPTETKDFFEKTVGSAFVTEVSGFQTEGGGSKSYTGSTQASVQTRARASYDGLRSFKEGQAIVTFGSAVMECRIFYSNPGHAKAMRVTRFLALPPPDEQIIKHAGAITELRDRMVNKSWTAKRADVALETSPQIQALLDGFKVGEGAENKSEAGITSLIGVHALKEMVPELPAQTGAPKAQSAAPSAPSVPSAPPPAQPASPLQPPKAEDKPAAPAPEKAQENKPASGQPSNPMGFFGSKPAGDQPSEAKKSEEQKPSETPKAPASEDKPAAVGSSPLSKFAAPKKDVPEEKKEEKAETKTPVTPVAAPPAQAPKPVASAPVTAKSPKDLPKITLSAEAESIITKAAYEAGRKLFKEGRKKDEA